MGTVALLAGGAIKSGTSLPISRDSRTAICTTGAMSSRRSICARSSGDCWWSSSTCRPRSCERQSSGGPSRSNRRPGSSRGPLDRKSAGTRVKIHGSETASPSLDFAGTNPYSDARDSALARRVPAGTLFLFAGVAQLVRAPACHAGGRGFKSRRSRHHFNTLALGLLDRRPGTDEARFARRRV